MIGTLQYIPLTPPNVTALEITVGHRTLSDPKLKMSDQNQTQPDIMSDQSRRIKNKFLYMNF